MDEQAIGANIRNIRLESKATLTAVAKKAQITKSTLSKIETGHISSPISTLIRIAKVLKVPVTEFFSEEKPPLTYVVTRKGKGDVVIQEGSKFGYSYEALALAKPNKYVEPFILTVKPDDPPGSFHHEGQEFLYVLSGVLEFTIGKDILTLKPGDSIFYDSNIVHKTKVVGKKAAKFLAIFIQELS